MAVWSPISFHFHPLNHPSSYSCILLAILESNSKFSTTFTHFSLPLILFKVIASHVAFLLPLCAMPFHFFYAYSSFLTLQHLASFSQPHPPLALPLQGTMITWTFLSSYFSLFSLSLGFDRGPLTRSTNPERMCNPLSSSSTSAIWYGLPHLLAVSSTLLTPKRNSHTLKVHMYYCCCRQDHTC